MKNHVRRIYRERKHKKGMKEARIRNLEVRCEHQKIINEILIKEIEDLKAKVQ